MSTIQCGIDFGTSNSAVTAVVSGKVSLVEVEDGKITIPTAVFFNVEEDRVLYGRAAIDEYLEGYSGRLMRSLKSILGSSLINEATQVGYDRVSFSEIIGQFIKHLKSVTENKTERELSNAVIGRPVFFVDDDPVADKKAEDELKFIALSQGFKDVSFEFEPIAAARDYESGIKKEELVLVVDIGGGTSDFSLIRLSPDLHNKDDRSSDILANSGVHIGGTDFDQRFSLRSVMPSMGYRSKLKNGLDMPVSAYHTLATWHLINTLYTPKNKSLLRDLYGQAADRAAFNRFMNVIESQKGHTLASAVEDAKIKLSDDMATRLDLDFIEPNWGLEVSRLDLEAASRAQIDKIVSVAKDTVVKMAGINSEDIHTVFLTGGTTGLPGFFGAIQMAFPHATLIKGDLFSSVAKGLGISALRRYG